MVRLAVLSAWAELQIQSTQRAYLIDIVAPYISTLIPMWLDTLTAYSRLQFEPEVGDGMITEEVIVDSQSDFVSKEFLLRVSVSLLPLLIEDIPIMLASNHQCCCHTYRTRERTYFWGARLSQH